MFTIHRVILTGDTFGPRIPPSMTSATMQMEDRQKDNDGSVVVGKLTGSIKVEEQVSFQKIRRPLDQREKEKEREKEITHYTFHEKNRKALRDYICLINDIEN